MGTVSKKFPGSRFSPCCFSTSKADGICVYGSKNRYIPSGYDIHSLPWKDPPFSSLVNHLFRLGPSIPWRTVSHNQRVWEHGMVYCGLLLKMIGLYYGFLGLFFVEDKTMNSKHSHHSFWQNGKKARKRNRSYSIPSCNSRVGVMHKRAGLAEWKVATEWDISWDLRW